MIDVLQINQRSDIPKYRQLENAIAEGVSNGTLPKNTQLPSLNEVATAFGLSKDTVVKAYNALRERGIIVSTHGKGYFITGEYQTPKKKVFILFNELNAYKEILHKSLINFLGKEVEIETFFHNHNIEVFEYLIDKALGNYTHYVVMPTFNTHQKRVLKAIQQIPSKKLFLIDRRLSEVVGGSIYQDFRNDALLGLQQLEKAIKKYKKVNVLYQKGYMHPYASIQGIKDYCQKENMPLELKTEIAEIEKGALYVCLKDADLVKLVKLADAKGLYPGQDYGILSYNESPMKEIIHQGITVISTDFNAMGEKVAAMILGGYQEQIANPVKIIERQSI